MKKILIGSLSMLILISFCLAACNTAGGPTEDDAFQMAETLVAIAFTQTAMAENQEPGIEPAEPTAPLPTETPVEEAAISEEIIAPTEIAHQVTPGNPGWVNKWFFDTDASVTASGGYVTGGDDYTANLYERPFTEDEMVYRPDVDINKTEISEDNTFYYVTIYLHNQHPEGGFQAAYGVEIDEDLDGRGDLLVIADRPSSTQWDIAGVSVWRDANNDVGGQRILRPDDNYPGDSYEQELFSINVLTDPDAAWARVSQGSPASVTIAFKKSLVSRSTFVWGAWAADNLLDPTLFDHHDHFTQADAGSPYASHSTYPLKALNLVDNTCRETYKFEATAPIPGLCYLPEDPTPTPEPITTPGTTQPPPTAEPTDPPPTAEDFVGNITGVAFDDLNNNGRRDAGEPTTVYTVTIYYRIGSCSNAIAGSTNNNPFNFAPLPPGTYCVQISLAGPMKTPNYYLINLEANETVYVEFGFEVAY